MKRIIAFLIIIYPLFSFAQDAGKRGIILNSPGNSLTGTTYAIVIGISTYKEVTALKFADRDAKIFADYLLSKNGAALDSDKVKLFVNEKATLNNIGNALSDIMISNLKKGDRIVFFFAGHGDYDARILKDQALLLLYGAPKQNYFQNIFSGDFISTADLNSRFVEPLAAKGCEVMLVVDACHATGLNKNLSGGVEGGKITTMALQNMTSPVKLYSCQANEYSLESEQWGGGRGLFSYVLMEGLYGMADADNNKIVTLRELQRYLEDNVASMAAPNKQNPIIKIEDPTQAVSKVDAAFLTAYRSKKNKNLTFIAKVDTKGSTDNWMNTMDSTQKKLYRECDSLTEKMQLDAAYQKFELFAKTDSSSNASLQLRRNLSAALQHKTAVILNPMFEDVSNVTKFSQKDVEEAESNLEKATLLLGKQNFLYTNLQARVLLLKTLVIIKKRALPRYNEAMGYLRRSLIAEPNAPYTYFYLGFLFDSDNKFDSAKLYYDKYINLIPNSAWGHMNLGITFCRTKNYEEGLKNYNIALQLDPGLADIYNNLGVMYRSLNKNEEAIKNYKKAIELRPDFASVYNNLGVTYYIMGNYDEALKDCIKAVELNPEYENAYSTLGSTYYALNDYENAIKSFNKAIKLKPDNPGFYSNVGNVYHSANDYEEAMRNFKKALELRPDIPQVYSSIGDLYNDMNQKDSAVKNLKRSLELNPKSVFANEKLGEVYNSINKYEDGLLYGSKAIKIDSGNVDAYTVMGRAYTGLNNYPEALKNYTIALRLKTADGKAHYGICCLYAVQKLTDSALHYLELSLQDPKSVDLVKQLPIMAADAALKNIRGIPQFKAIMEKYYKKEELEKYPSIYVLPH